MLNTTMLNTAPLNDWLQVVASFSVSDFDDINFDNFGLQNASVISQQIEVSSAPQRELRRFRTPRGDGGGWQGEYMRERIVRVSGILKKSTASELETFIDLFKRRMTKAEGNLDIKVNGTMRRCVATLQNTDAMFKRRQGHHVTICPFDLDFVTLDPMFKDFDYTAQTNFNLTNLAWSESVENLGTYRAPAVLVILVDAANAITGCNFRNNTNGEEIEITETISAGDIIVFDSEQNSVTLNGTEVEYNGRFPYLEYGANSYTITLTGTSATYTPTLKFKKHYL